MSKTFILECGRINSVGVAGSGEDADNKSSWRNQIKPVYLRQGDTVSLQNVLINVPGADTNAIQFQGSSSSPNTNVQDNFTLMKVGFYINHNGTNTLALPCHYESYGVPPTAGTKKVMNTETDKTIINGEGIRVIANGYGSFKDEQYIFDGSQDISEQANLLKDSGSWQGNNPFFNINGKKFAKIHPYYAGWKRVTTANAYLGNGVEPKLLTEEIPILIDAGFTAPQSIADQMTEILSRTNKIKGKKEDLFIAEARAIKDYYEPTYSQYGFNGFTYKTTSCNFQKHGDQPHRIYGNIAVDEPYQWKYGINIISNCQVDNLKGNRYITEGQSADKVNYTVDYPVYIWNRFIGSDPSVFDIDLEGQYSYYCPNRSEVIGNPGGVTVLTSEGFSSNLSSFNDTFRQVLTGNEGAYLYMTGSNNFKLGLTSDIGTNIVDKPGLFEDNDNANSTDIIAYNRFLGLNGNWTAVEHQIFKNTNLGNPNGSQPYQYSGTGTPDADDFFAYVNAGGGQLVDNTIIMGISDGGLGNIGYKYLFNCLTSESGGIIEGGHYKISFTLAINAPYDWNTSGIRIGVGGNGGIGLSFQSFNTDGDQEISFVATASSIATNAIAFGVYYNNLGAEVTVSNISILREYVGGENETYTISNIWTSDYTDTEDNKIYSLQKNNSQSNIELEISDNTIPVQTPTYTGVDFNRVYTLLTKGLVFSFSSGSYSVTSSLNGHDSNVSVFYNNDDADYTYWIFQSFSSPTTWYAYRLSKYVGGLPENGDIIGTIQSNGVLLKFSPRNGQQYINLENSNNYTFTTNFVDLSAGNNWNTNSSFTGNSYAMINHIGDGQTINIGGSDYAYDWELDQQGGGPNEYYFQLNEDGVSGNWKYETGASEGTWTYDGTNITAVATIGSGFTLHSASPPALTNKIVANILITNEDFNNPPGLPWSAERKYYYTFQRYISTSTGYRTYYISTIETDPDDTALAGLKGTVYTASGVSNEGTWLIDTVAKTWTSGIISDPLVLTTTTTLTLSNAVQYPTSQNYVQGGITYSIPTDGQQYGSGYESYGDTDIETVSSPIKYLGCENNTDFDNLQDITNGRQYDALLDSFSADNGYKWTLVQDAVNLVYKMEIFKISNNERILTISKPYTEIFPNGWIILRCNSLTRTELQTNDTTISSATIKAYFTTQSEDIPNGLKSPSTNGQTGQQYQFYENQSFTPIYDTGTLKTFENADIRTSKAHLQKHQLLMTNIVLNMDNLKKVEDLFRYTETYIGSYTKNSKIVKDFENYFTMLDIGVGDDAYIDTTNATASTNTTGQRPLVQEYMRDQGQMDKDNGDQDTMNIGCMSPRYTPVISEEGKENRVRIFTRWKDDYNSRIEAENMLDFEFCYGDTLTLYDFKKNNSELYAYCKNNNVGIIPFKAKDGTLRIGFEIFEDYINSEILKIQNLTSAIYSPAFVDHNYVGITNNDDPAETVSGDTSGNLYTNDARYMMNFLNIGANKPTVQYSNDFSRFSFSYFHTSQFFNAITDGGSTSQLGDEIAIIFDQNDNLRNQTFPVATIRGQKQGKCNTGINESQAGIYISDVFYKKVTDGIITSSSDPLAVKMTKETYYNSFWFKLGFSFYDLKPIRYTYKAFHDNRFSQLAYNNSSPSYRESGLVPFTTNAFLSINNMPSMNIFTKNSDDDQRANPNAGQPIFGLGYNNCQVVSIATESATLFPKSLPFNISSGYLRIHTDLPIDTLEYNAQSSDMAVIGSALLNYASSSQFFYSYAMNYTATITKDVLVNNIKIEIRTDRGELVQGLGDRSLVVMKVERAFQQTVAPNPELEELKKIEKTLKDKDTEEESNKSLRDVADTLYELTKILAEEQDVEQQRSIINTFFEEIDNNVKSLPKGERLQVLKKVANLLNKSTNRGELKNIEFVAFQSLSDAILNPSKPKYVKAERPLSITNILKNLDNRVRDILAGRAKGEPGEVAGAASMFEMLKELTPKEFEEAAKMWLKSRSNTEPTDEQIARSEPMRNIIKSVIREESKIQDIETKKADRSGGASKDPDE